MANHRKTKKCCTRLLRLKKTRDHFFLFLYEDRKNETLHRLDFTKIVFLNVSMLESPPIPVDSIVHQSFV